MRHGQLPARVGAQRHDLGRTQRARGDDAVLHRSRAHRLHEHGNAELDLLVVALGSATPQRACQEQDNGRPGPSNHGFLSVKAAIVSSVPPEIGFQRTASA